MKLGMLSVAMLVLMCGAAGAEEFHAKASVIVPNLVHQYAGPSYFTVPFINLTNITDKTISCRVTMYDHDANDVTNLGKVYTGGANWTLISSGTGNFEIPAHATRMFSLSQTAPLRAITGHAVIEWTSDDPLLRKALVGGVWMYRMDGGGVGQSIGYFLVNHGDPF